MCIRDSGLLVPATMRLMGRWNWWAPAPVRSVVDRLGLSHHSTAPVASAGTRQFPCAESASTGLTRYRNHAAIRVKGTSCLLYTSDAADDLTRVDLGGRRIIKKKK